MKKRKVIAKVEKYFDTEKQQYCAKISFFLPTNRDGNVVEDFLSNKDTLTYVTLYKDWGIRADDAGFKHYRYSWHTIREQTKDVLEQKAKEYVEKCFTFLEELANRNRKADNEIRQVSFFKREI